MTFDTLITSNMSMNGSTSGLMSNSSSNFTSYHHMPPPHPFANFTNNRYHSYENEIYTTKEAVEIVWTIVATCMIFFM